MPCLICHLTQTSAIIFMARRRAEAEALAVSKYCILQCRRKTLNTGKQGAHPRRSHPPDLQLPRMPPAAPPWNGMLTLLKMENWWYFIGLLCDRLCVIVLIGKACGAGEEVIQQLRPQAACPCKEPEFDSQHPCQMSHNGLQIQL